MYLLTSQSGIISAVTAMNQFQLRNASAALET